MPIKPGLRYLKNYTLHAWARLDNNVAERAVRPLALGRKNWLFVGNEDGGEAAAVIFSLVQSCRSLGINPRNYLEDIMPKLMRIMLKNSMSFCLTNEQRIVNNDCLISSNTFTFDAYLSDYQIITGFFHCRSVRIKCQNVKPGPNLFYSLVSRRLKPAQTSAR